MKKSNYNNLDRLQSLMKALKYCKPLNDSLLIRLFERVGCNSN